jgi:hypothetical protein
MEEKRVVITVGKDGSVRVEAFGFVGGECVDATQFLDKLFGEPKKRKLKDSFYKEKNKSTDFMIDGLPSGHCG